MVQPDIKKFHESVSEEFKDLRNRVRNLIGSSHWGEDGRYKEAIFRKVLGNFIAEDYIIKTGFIVEKLNEEIRTTSQIDVLIIDNSYPVLFSEGDFVITTRANVKGVIEIKTELEFSNRETIQKATKHRKIVRSSSVFNGIFAYECSGDPEGKAFRYALKESGGKVNHLCLGKDYFIKYWEQSTSTPVDNAYRAYDLDGMAFSYFIGNLIECLYPDASRERGWFLFPLDEGKEIHKMFDVSI